MDNNAIVASDAYEADVCLIVEGCYPFIRGGVSTWLDWLMRKQPDLTFSVIAISASKTGRKPVYEFPPNMRGFHELFLHDFGHDAHFGHRQRELSKQLAQPLQQLFAGGGLQEFAQIDRLINAPEHPLSLCNLMNSALGWDVLTELYEKTMPQASFFHYFWAWRALFGGMFAAMKYSLPPARIYHTISTGYAGLLAARAHLETGRPVIITEHGIYTNERRIEILMAEWIADTVDKGLSLNDDRFDLRDMWICAFEAYARTCYQAASCITTLYEDNQKLQRSLGASEDKLLVIANGIDFKRFSVLPRAGRKDRPTLALIGRVVPIKDVKTYISAAHLVHQRIPDLRVIVMGPMDEDEEYNAECQTLVAELDMGEVIEFTGPVQITDYLPQVHVVALTSLSEAQPLVLLEAGAAGIPCVTTDVGSCREIIEGRSDEIPPLGRGGIVADLVAPDKIADAICTILLDMDKQWEYGESLRKRVETYYITENAAKAYGDLYRTYCNDDDMKLHRHGGN